jgi:PIN domain nuclease of toxin-antitoxin system
MRERRRLTKAARLLLAGAIEIYVSSASIWAAAIKVKLGNLDVDVGRGSLFVARGTLIGQDKSATMAR